jgi:molybdate transport system substrate-binding protein
LALADPDHVPAGVYAKAALECGQLWTELSGRIVAVVDVRGALAAVDEGAADAAVVYESDVKFAPQLHASRPFQRDCEPDVVYTLGLARESGDLAVQFAEHLLDSSLASTWTAFGFSPGRSVRW